MKQYLFLYPIKEYVGSLIENHEINFREKGLEVNHLNTLIEKRYRDKHYNINWLLFSLENDNSKPDYSNISELIEIHKGDRILNAGISFRQSSNERYTSHSFVISFRRIPFDRLCG